MWKGFWQILHGKIKKRKTCLVFEIPRFNCQYKKKMVKWFFFLQKKKLYIWKLQIIVPFYWNLIARHQAFRALLTRIGWSQFIGFKYSLARHQAKERADCPGRKVNVRANNYSLRKKLFGHWRQMLSYRPGLGKEVTD